MEKEEKNSFARKVKTSNKNDKKHGSGDCHSAGSSSHTKFLMLDEHSNTFKEVNRSEYFEVSESMSTSDTFQCVHGKEGKKNTTKGLLKRNLLKNLDPIPMNQKWTETCEARASWDLANILEFLVLDPTVSEQTERLTSHVVDFAEVTKDGFRIDILNSVCTALDYLVEGVYSKEPLLELCHPLALLLKNIQKSILLTAMSDVEKYFESLRNYLGFLGYLMIRVEDDNYFDLVAKGLIWQLSAADTERRSGSVRLQHTLAAAGPVLYDTIVRMIAVATHSRFPAFLQTGLLLACNSSENCMEMMERNIIENIFSRFNPYFPQRELPSYFEDPADPDNDPNVRLGDSTIHMSTTMSLLLILLKTTIGFLREQPEKTRRLPCPNAYAQRCFIWAYRYESRARGRSHQRTTLTTIITSMLQCFGNKLDSWSPWLMPDILTLSVLTEIPPMDNWTSTVNFNLSQSDVQYKKQLIYLSVDFLKTFAYNHFMVESRYWVLGLMYLLDPGLSHHRIKWAPSLFAEIRKASFQALVCTLRYFPSRLVQEYGFIRRLLWYVEWYCDNPYELTTLYWSLRLLQVAVQHHQLPNSNLILQDLFDTRGVFILMNLCYKLIENKFPPVEKSQAIMALSLQLLKDALESKMHTTSMLHRDLHLPSSITTFSRKILDTVLNSLRNNFIISDKWLISLLDLIWTCVITKQEYRKIFVSNEGVYKLMDLITMTRVPVQTIALALISDIVRAGDAVGQLVTWRANHEASNANPPLVKRGSTVASLLAALFRDDCTRNGIQLTDEGMIRDLDYPLISTYARQVLHNPESCRDKSLRTAVCVAAGELAGSRMSKVFAILHMLSEDLHHKVSLADETYNLYKNIQLKPKDEVMLVLCSHYLTLKINEVWLETHLQPYDPIPPDDSVLEELLEIGKEWAKAIRLQMEEVLNFDKMKEFEEEHNLYSFLGKVRLNIALDALREVRCVARSADRRNLTFSLLADAVRAHHRRSTTGSVLRTYHPPLDSQNITGQYVKILSNDPTRKSMANVPPSSKLDQQKLNLTSLKK